MCSPVAYEWRFDFPLRLSSRLGRREARLGPCYAYPPAGAMYDDSDNVVRLYSTPKCGERVLFVMPLPPGTRFAVWRQGQTAAAALSGASGGDGPPPGDRDSPCHFVADGCYINVEGASDEMILILTPEDEHGMPPQVYYVPALDCIMVGQFEVARPAASGADATCITASTHVELNCIPRVDDVVCIDYGDKVPTLF